jgi:hypothetical protein
MRFVFSPPADSAAGLLDLPWEQPLAEWTDSRLVDVRQRGISRHIVRFIADANGVYALKEIHEDLARREYGLLRRLSELEIPSVDPLGVVVDRGRHGDTDLDAILVTHYLNYSTSYRALFSAPNRPQPIDRLLDALIELLVRLHLAGFYWGDCSLSNTLFRHDAGSFEAYLVDAETSEQHATMSSGARSDDVTRAEERVGGELLDLQAGGLLSADIDPVDLAEEVSRRYDRLWDELNQEEILAPEEQRYRIRDRVARLNELGFDVDEVELKSVEGGNRVRFRTRVAEPGHHRRLLAARTGLDAEENQARRLLNDIASFRGYLEQKQHLRTSDAVAALRWLTDIYEPVVAAIPDDLKDRLPPAEIFHEVLEHRWYLSETAGRDVGTTAAANSYFTRILPTVPDATPEPATEPVEL